MGSLVSFSNHPKVVTRPWIFGALYVFNVSSTRKGFAVYATTIFINRDVAVSHVTHNSVWRTLVFASTGAAYHVISVQL